MNEYEYGGLDVGRGCLWLILAVVGVAVLALAAVAGIDQWGDAQDAQAQRLQAQAQLERAQAQADATRIEAREAAFEQRLATMAVALTALTGGLDLVDLWLLAAVGVAALLGGVIIGRKRR
ncbi:MAG TPA: hypothetical protein ENJ31_01545 [Anaerolineae bacterium]|nr:hypothetical protein [Anaerolineae bacterium]